MPERTNASSKEIDRIYEQHVRTFGFVVPSRLASHLVPRVDRDHPAREEIKRIVLRQPTKEHLYDHSQETLQNLLAQGDHVRIWTDDYMLRVATSGLISGLRRGLPRSERGRFHVAHYPDHRAVHDKIPLLPHLFDEARRLHIQTVTIVDNNPRIIASAAGEARQVAPDLSVNLVHINHGRPVEFIPPLDEPDNISYRALHSVADLDDIRQEMLGPDQQKAFWVVDFNETLMDRKGLEHAIRGELAKVLSTDQPNPGSG